MHFATEQTTRRTVRYTAVLLLLGLLLAAPLRAQETPHVYRAFV